MAKVIILNIALFFDKKEFYLYVKEFIFIIHTTT